MKTFLRGAIELLRARRLPTGLKRMARHAALTGVLSLLFVGSIQTAVALPNHPGALLKQADLDRVRSNVAANREPWASAWAAIKDTGPGPTWNTGATGVITNSYAMQDQGHAIWQLTVKWVVSGDIAYANAAQKGIDQWVNNVTAMTTTTIRTGIGATQMANAAEILAHGFGGSAGWPAANVAKAKAWFKRVPYTRVSGGVGQRTGNWGTSALAGCMTMAIFCDDQTMFDYAVNAYKLGFRDTTDGNCGVTQYIDSTGEAMESGRDRGHVQGGMGHLVEVALMAWNQNVNIVTYNDNQCTTGVNGPYGVSGANRLLLGMEYEAKYNLGGTVSYHPFLTNWGQVYYPNGIAPRAGWSPVWEMANRLFFLSGMNQVYTPQVLQVPGYVPEYSNGDHIGYGTLLFRADLDLPAAGTYSLKNRSSGKILDNEGISYNGAPVGLWSDTTSNNQRWALSYVSTNVVRLRCVTGARFLDGAGRTNDGALVAQWQDSPSNNLRWTIISVGGGYFKLKNVATGMCLDSGTSPWPNGDDVRLYTDGTSQNQQWQFIAP